MAVLRSALPLVLAAAVLYGMQHSRPFYSDITSPVAISGEMKERVAASSFALTLDTVRVARELQIETFGKSKPYSTSGVWVIVVGKAEALRETLALTAAEWLGTEGLHYDLTDRIPATIEMLPGNSFQPGIPRRALIVFEMPEDAVEAGTVVVAPSKLSPLGDEIRISTANAGDVAIEPSITIRRNDEGPRWTVLPEK